VLVDLFPPPPGLRVDVVDVVLFSGGLGGFRIGLGAEVVLVHLFPDGAK
jgi:hypothetical protein